LSVLEKLVGGAERKAIAGSMATHSSDHAQLHFIDNKDAKENVIYLANARVENLY
jgi:hypothetical protein